MLALMVMKDGTAILVYLEYELEDRYYLGNWVFISKADVKEIIFPKYGGLK